MGKRDALVSSPVSTESSPSAAVARRKVRSQVRTETAVTTPVTTQKPSPPELNIELAEGQSEEQAIAKAATSPVMSSMLTRSAFSIAPFDRVDPGEHVREISTQVKRAQENDMDGVVSMLMSQAHTLDAIFNSLASRAAQHVGKNGPALDLYLRQALRAQSQCRSTLEAVAEVKNPRPTAFIKQQNNAAGHQQVNNGAAPIAHNASEMTHRKT